jgi:hypothetical protein
MSCTTTLSVISRHTEPPSRANSPMMPADRFHETGGDQLNQMKLDVVAELALQ